MAFELMTLPYAQDALAPHMSAQTLSFHHGKHHKTYVDNLNKFVAGTALEGQTLEQIVRATAGNAEKAAIFNNAAQVWNHDFFWNSLKPNGGGEPTGALAAALKAGFGGVDGFKEQFKAAGVGQFGSGWAWLVAEKGALKIVKTANAANPLSDGQTPLLTCDVWEHAYYLDYQNRRADMIQTFLDHLANWDFAATNFAKAG